MHKRPRFCNSLITKTFKIWRRGESEHRGVLKARKLLKNRNAANAKNSKIGLNWNVTGTRDLLFPQFFRPRLEDTSLRFPDLTAKVNHQMQE